MKKPNIVFLTIDSLRSDKVFGKYKKSRIPNLEKIIKTGMFFPNTITSGDATDPSLGSIFTGTHPFINNVTFYKNHKKANHFFNILKNNGYHLYSMLPQKTFFNTLSDSFDNSERYDTDPYVLMYQGTGDKIIQKLKSKSFVEPWIYYIHLMDLHPSGEKFAFPKKYESSDFGLNNYEKTISALDLWIGKIFDNLDTSNTIFILTSDHGDFIPMSGKRIDDISTIQNKLKPLKKILPFGENFWGYSLGKTKSIVKKIRTSKNKQNLNESQIRSLYNRVEGYLFDEIVKVPLILFIPGQKSGIFNEQISALDIIPTLFELLDIDYSNELNGQSLLPLINNLEWNEKPVYFETSSASPTKKGDAFGVRTSKFKYFRHRSNLQSRYLFDLKNDPLEQNNLVLSDENQSKKMEKLLKSFILLSSEKEKIHSSIKKKQWGF